MFKSTSLVFLFTILLLYNKVSRAQSISDKVKTYLVNEMERQKIPGLQIVVIYQNKVILSKALGIANVEFSVPPNEHTIFSINSITKVFTGTAIMQLVEEGKIDIEKPASDYLDSLPPNWQSITIKQLLSHTSGLPNVEDDYTGGLVGNKGEDTAWKIVKAMPLEFLPGEQFSYNATNYLLLGKIIEKYGKLPFEQFIQKYQLDVVGMKRTLYGNSYNVVKNKAPTYSFYSQDKSTGEYIKYNQLLEVHEEFPKMLRTDAGMFSSAEEIAQWVIALQTKRLLKDDKSIKTMWTPVKLNNGVYGGFGDILNAYALGWPVVERKQHPAVAPIGGGRAAFLIYPQDDLTIILLTNLTGCSPELIVDKIAEFYFK
jgi:CubicO group peptidase (beta-lactamase class C family)